MTADDPTSNTPAGAQVLALAEAQLAALGDNFDAAALMALRTVVRGYPDVCGDPVGEVVDSLSHLLDNLIAAGRVDRLALGVHVQAWRLMVNDEPDALSRANMVEGLHAVRDLYAQKAAKAA